MTESTYNALPKRLARELREGAAPALAILPEPASPQDHRRMLDLVLRHAATAGAESA